MINLILTSGREAGHIIRQFKNRSEAEEALANIANEDGILTETAWAGQSAELREA